MRKQVLFVCILITLGLLGTSPGVWAATYNVTNYSADVTTPGSLPWCVNAANNVTPGQPDTINFAISNSITVHTVLTIVDQVDIRGNSNSVGCHDGTGAGRQNCFAFATNSHGSTITGLAIVDSTTGIALLSNGNHVANCRVGLDWAGVARNNIWGIYDQGQDNWIGGGPGERNIISNNSTSGILLTNSLRGRIQGNYIGTNIAGNAGLGTQAVGIDLNPGVQTLIGGNQLAGEGNVISGHTAYGVILEDENSFGNTLCGNVIGLTQDESTALPNMADGVRIHRSSGNAIGLPVAGHQNVIAGNQTYNLIFYSLSGLSPRPRLNIVQNNFIGVNSSSVGFATSSYNLYLNNADANLVGGNRNTLERNVISGDGAGSYGLYLIGHGNTISGNYIGTDDGGNNARPNTVGINMSGSVNGNIIGGENQGGSIRGNVISGNLSFGILAQSGMDNAFYGNYIGLDGTGGIALGNGNRGLYLGGGSSRSRVGDLSPERRNVFADNGFGALVILYTSNNRIEGNYFGMNAAGTIALPDGNFSIEVTGAPRNWIAGNACSQTVSINGLNCTGNTLVANRIGILPNGGSTGENNGMSLSNSATGNFIGLPGGQGNLISGLSQYGIVLDNGTVVNNGLYGNTITACATNIALLSGANNNHPAPVIGSALANSLISGTAGANDYIEVFIAEGAAGNGGSLRFVGFATADGGGNWSLPANGLYVSGDYVCALATDSGNNTSEFSTNVLVVDPTPTPSPTISPTTTMTPTVTASPTATETPALGNVDLGGKQVLAYPNPAQDQMTFLFHLDQAVEVKILIYNLAGERVADLSGDFTVGRGQTLVWDCGDVAPGIYLARYLVAGEVKETIKIAVVK